MKCLERSEEEGCFMGVTSEFIASPCVHYVKSILLFYMDLPENE